MSYSFQKLITGLLWKIFSGVKKSTKQPAAVFVLEKRSLDAKYPGNEHKNERERLLDQIRKSIGQLTRLRHPQILTVQFPLEESRDCLAFATGQLKFRFKIMVIYCIIPEVLENLKYRVMKCANTVILEYFNIKE